MPKFSLKKTQNGVTPNEDAKCRWGRLNAVEIAENWRLFMQSVVSLAQSQVYHTERIFAVMQCVMQSLSATAYPCTIPKYLI